MANVSQLTIRADFLHYYGLLIDIPTPQLPLQSCRKIFSKGNSRPRRFTYGNLLRRMANQMDCTITRLSQRHSRVTRVHDVIYELHIRPTVVRAITMSIARPPSYRKKGIRIYETDGHMPTVIEFVRQSINIFCIQFQR